MRLEQIWQEISPRLSTNLLPSQKGTGSFKMNTSAISFYENENRHTIWPRNSIGEKYVPKEAFSRMIIAVLFIIVKKQNKNKTQDTTWMPTSRGAVHQYNKEGCKTSKKDEENLSVCTKYTQDFIQWKEASCPTKSANVMTPFTQNKTKCQPNKSMELDMTIDVC